MKIKNSNKVFIALLLAICLVFSVTACTPVEVGVTSVALDRAGASLEIGDEITLNALVMPSGAAATVTWMSSDTSVATVDGGKVKAVGEGTAIIRATAGGKHDDCTVTVTDPSKAVVSPTGVKLDKSKLPLSVDESATLVATVLPANATNKAVTWTSTMPAVATVDNTGKVTAHAAGKTIIKATTFNNYIAVCNVTVSGETGGGGASVAAGGLYVKKVDSLSTRSTDFVMGMDASAVPAIEAAHGDTNGNHTYKNFDGEYEDVYKILKDNGITDIRIRVWNDPYDADGNSYGGGNCDVANAVAIAERCQAVGLGVIINFHYSDFWADPSRQKRPKAWSSYTTAQVADAIYDFTKDSLEAIAETGVTISMVQVGNEITTGLAGANWNDNGVTISSYINKGAKAVRDVTGTVTEGGAKVVVHFTDPNSQDYVGFAAMLKQNDVDYDVFGSSYYSVWHGTLTNLANKLRSVHDAYNKEVMVMETSYAFTLEDADSCGNTAFSMQGYPATIQGQTNSVRDVIETVANLGDYGLGVCYWEGTWIAASESSDGNTNRALCTQYGCGWASHYSIGYDTKADGDGGCTEDNRTFWLSNGTALESLKVFKLVCEGQSVSISADYLYEQESSYTVNEGPIVIPETVSAILNTGATISLTAYWDDATEEDLAHYISTVGEYIIEGTTDYGGTCIFKLDVHNYNLCPNGSFEDCTTMSGNDTIQETGLAGWNFAYTKADSSVLQLYASDDTNNVKLGIKSIHFSDQATVSFRVYQTLQASVWSDYGVGTYGVSFDIQGDTVSASTLDIHAYATVTYNSGETQTFTSDKVSLDGWKVWNRASLTVDIDANVTSVEIGMSVYAEQPNESAWPWGNIDNAQFYFIG